MSAWQSHMCYFYDDCILILALIVRENMKASEEDRLPDEEVLAQMGCVSASRIISSPLTGPLTFHRMRT